MAQRGHILVAGRAVPLPEEAIKLVANRVQVVIEQVGAGARLQRQPVTVVVNDLLNAVGFRVGEDL